MKKQVLILLTLCISSLCNSQVVGDTFIENNITYRITSLSPNEVEVINYNINGGINVVIPTSVTPNASGRFSQLNNDNNLLSTYTVTAIATNAFNGKGIYSVDIPDSVLTIGNQAFAINFITSVNLGNGVNNIGFSAFFNNNLTTILIPDSVTEIQPRAFDDNLLTSVTIPSNLQTIGFAAFRDNPLTCVTSKATTPPTIVTDGLGNTDTFNVNRNGINLYIPAGTAAAYTSASWTGFNNVTETQGNTFVVNYITYQITSSTTVRTYEYNVAGGTVVNIPASVDFACITYNVSEIGNNSFYQNNLTSVTIPNSVINIGQSAFFNNDLLTVTIPDNVITIGDGAFAQNQNMSNLVLGDNLTTIGGFAFRFCALNEITIPASVTNIGVVAFGGLAGPSAITDVYCQGMVPPTISTSSLPNSDTFNQVRNTIHLHIPAGTMGVYVTDSGALWTGFAPVTEDALSTSNFELENEVKVITTSNELEISYSNNIALESYTIYSITGAKIKEGSENNIAIDDMSNGVYILKLDFDKGTAVRKFAK
jgi:hypothetical protein